MSTNETDSSAAKKRKAEDCCIVAIENEEMHALKEELSKTKAENSELRVKLLDTEGKLEAALQKIANSQQEEDDDAFEDDEESVALDSSDPWNAKYLELRTYRIINGNCKVPKNYPKLGSWVDNQRTAYKNVKFGKSGRQISQEQIAMLEGLGFSWGQKFSPPVSWEECYEELKQYQQAVGNCNIPIHETNPSPLAMWVLAQRSEYRRFRKGQDSLLTPDQIGQLKEIRFKWKA